MNQQQQVGPYTVVRELGRGGMGVVYEVRHPDIPRPLALKLQLDVADAQALTRFQREGELLARINHPGVIRVHGTGSTARGYPYLVTEFVAGRPLDEVAKEGIASEDAARLVAELCKALSALHSAGIIHRDLKPKNVILTPDGRPILLDFGIARDVAGERMTRTGQMIGTPAFMAPEQIDNASAVDERCDVYGLGAILFHLLAGRDPFVANGLPALLKKIFKDPPQWPADRDVPAGLRAVCLRALAKEPNDRPPNPAALAAELEADLRGERGAGSRRGPLLAGGALALAGLLAALALLGRASPPPPPPPKPPTPAPRVPTPPSPKPRRAPFPKQALERLVALKESAEPSDGLERARAYREAVEWLRLNREHDPGRADQVRAALNEGGERSVRAQHLLKTIIQDAPSGAVVGGGFLDEGRIALHSSDPANPVVMTRGLDEELRWVKRLPARVRVDPSGRRLSSSLRASAIHHRPGGRTDLVFASDNHRVYWYQAEAPGQELSPRVRKRENLEQGDSTAFWGVPGENSGRRFSCVAFSADGEHLAAAGNWPVVFLLDRGGSSRQIGAGHLSERGGVGDLAFSTDGEYLLTTAYREWDEGARSSEQDAQLFRVRDGAHVRVVSEARAAARVTTLFHPERALFVLALQPRGEPARLAIYDVEAETLVFLQAEIPNGPRKGTPLPYAHFDPVDDLVASADGKRLYSASRTVQQPGTLTVWNTEDPSAPTWLRDVSLNNTTWARLSLSPGEHWILAIGSAVRTPGENVRARGAPVHLFGAGDW